MGPPVAPPYFQNSSNNLPSVSVQQGANSPIARETAVQEMKRRHRELSAEIDIFLRTAELTESQKNSLKSLQSAIPTGKITEISLLSQRYDLLSNRFDVLRRSFLGE